MKKFKYIAASVAASIALVGCGGSDGDSTQTGTFVDAPVAGLSYQTPTISGITDANGQFKYKAGEKVTFKLGDVEIGSVDGSSIVTPKNLGNDTAAANLAYILQNLDIDGNASDDVIKLPSADVIQTYFTNYGVTTLDLENNATVQTLLSGLKTEVKTQLQVNLPDVNVTEALANMESNVDGALLQSDSIELLLNKDYYLSIDWDDPQQFVVVKFRATNSSISLINLDNDDKITPTQVSIENNMLKFENGKEQTELKVVDVTDKGLLVYNADITNENEVTRTLRLFYKSQTDAQNALAYSESFTSDMLSGKTFYATVAIGGGSYQKANLSFTDTQFTSAIGTQQMTYDYTIENGVIKFTDTEDGAQELHLLAQTDKGFVTPDETDPDEGISPASVLLWYTNEADRDAAYAKLPQ